MIQGSTVLGNRDREKDIKYKILCVCKRGNIFPFRWGLTAQTFENLSNHNRVKGNQPWTFIGRTDAEAEVPILWPHDVKNCLIGKDIDAGKDWGQEEKGTTEDEMVGWHHWLNGHEFEQSLGDSGQGSLGATVHGVTKSRHDLETEQQQSERAMKN